MRRQAMGAYMELNKQICLAANESEEALLQLIQAKHTRMSLVNISTAFHRLARVITDCDGDHSPQRVAVASDGRLRGLLAQTKDQLQSNVALGERARCLSTIAWSCARLRVYDRELMMIIIDLAQITLEYFKPFELANLLWAVWKMPLMMESTPLFAKAHDHIVSHLQSYPLASLSMVAWVYANAWTSGISGQQSCYQLFHEAAELFAVKLECLTARGETANPVIIENLIWSCAHAQVSVRQHVLASIGNAALQVLGNFKAYELSITLWAFARLGARHDQLFYSAADLVCKSSLLRSNLHAQAIANMIWAFAKYGVPLPKGDALCAFAPAIRSLIPKCEELMPLMKQQEFSSLLWASSKLGETWGKDPTMDHLFLSTVCAMNARHGTDLLQQLTLQNVINMLRTCESFLGRQLPTVQAFPEFIAKMLRVCVSFRTELELDPYQAMSILELLPEGFSDDNFQDNAQDRPITELANITGRHIRSFSVAGLVRFAARVSVLCGESRVVLGSSIARCLLEVPLDDIPIAEWHHIAAMCGLQLEDASHKDVCAALRQQAMANLEVGHRCEERAFSGMAGSSSSCAASDLCGDLVECVAKQSPPAMDKFTFVSQVHQPAYMDIAEMAFEPPTIDIIDELTTEPLHHEKFVYITFEVNTAEKYMHLQVRVEIFCGGLHEVIESAIPAGNEVANTQSLVLDHPNAAPLEVHLTLIGPMHEVVGRKRVLVFRRAGDHSLARSQVETILQDELSGMSCTDDTTSTCSCSEDSSCF